MIDAQIKRMPLVVILKNIVFFKDLVSPQNLSFKKIKTAFIFHKMT